MMPPGPIITLTTDFGETDGYVGAVKGVILSICPQARIVDIAHHVPPHDVVQAAMTLEAATRYFPAGTVHLAVVDPGVGTERRRILALTEKAYYIGPDNGILGLVFRWEPPQRIFAIENTKFMLPGPTTTFDGRDVFAPAAAYIANGLDPGELGPDIEDVVPLDWPENAVTEHGVTGAVVSADRFGNVITSIHRRDLPEGSASFMARCKDQDIPGPAISYHKNEKRLAGNDYRAIFGSSGYLELALPGQSAQQKLHTTRGDVIQVNW